MNLGELEAALDLSVQDKSLRGYFAAWINNALLELAADLELPALKLQTPYSLVITTVAWIFDLPANFQKMLFRAVDSDYNEITIYRTFDTLDHLDIDHDDIGDHVTAVAVTEGETTGVATNKIGVYPKATETIYLWYYKKPTVLVNPTDTPTCIPGSYHGRVIIPKAMIIAHRLLQDQVENFDPKPIQYWESKLMGGLRGSPVDGIGLINYLSKIQGGPRRHGGRDPVGLNLH